MYDKDKTDEDAFSDAEELSIKPALATKSRSNGSMSADVLPDVM